MRIQLIPDARAATLTQKSRKMAEMPKARIERSKIGRLPKMHFRQFDANSTHSRRPRGDADAEVAQNGGKAKSPY